MGRARRMPTIKDVAREAGVSVGTASRVISGHASVASELRERVQRAVRRLGYKPNLAARALRTNRVDVLGLILPDITNPFFAQLAREVEVAAAARGLLVMLANTMGRADLEASRLEAVLDRSPRGVLIVPASDAAGDGGAGSGAALAGREGIPLVALDRPVPGLTLVSVDNRASAALAAEHLAALGHRRIAYLAGPPDTQVAREREAGFTRRLREVAPDATLLRAEGAFDYASGERVARAMGREVTAIAAASDQQAVGVIRAARDLGLRVPDDLSVVGFDDIALAALVVPRLTTIRQPARRLAEAAVARALDGGEGDVRELGELVVRDSTGAPGGPSGGAPRP